MFNSKKAQNQIENSKVISLITEFYNIVFNEPHTKEMLYFLHNWELDLAKAISYEFGDNSAKSLANAILSIKTLQV